VRTVMQKRLMLQGLSQDPGAGKAASWRE